MESVRKMLARHFSVRLLLLGSVVFLAACGGSGATQPPGATPPAQEAKSTPTTPTRPAQTPAATPQAAGAAIDPCSLLTKAEVEAAIGVAVTEPAREVVGPMAACNFNDPNAPIFRTVTVMVTTFDTSLQAKGAFEMITAERTSVPGIGDDAYWVELGFYSLSVLKGRYNVDVNVGPVDGKDRLAIAKGLAAKALARMP